MATIQTHLQEATKALAPTSQTAALDATLLLAHVLGKDKIGLIRDAQQDMLPEAAEQFAALLARRKKHEPVAHILGEKEFMGWTFKVTPATLIPRPDSETLINAVTAIFGASAQRKKLVDVGTGSGCLLLSLLKEYPNWQGVGVDKSAAALEIAQHNAEQLGLAACATFVEGEWLVPIQEEIDVLVSNPPYIKTEDMDSLMPDVRDFEPHMALDGGDDGLNPYRLLARTAPEVLRSGGYIFLEIGQGQAREVKEMLSTPDWHNLKTYTDLAGIVRVVSAQRV